MLCSGGTTSLRYVQRVESTSWPFTYVRLLSRNPCTSLPGMQMLGCQRIVSISLTAALLRRCVHCGQCEGPVLPIQVSLRHCDWNLPVCPCESVFALRRATLTRLRNITGQFGSLNLPVQVSLQQLKSSPSNSRTAQPTMHLCLLFCLQVLIMTAKRRFMSTILPYFDAEPFIERYFYFSLRNSGNPGGWIFQSSTSSALTAIGDLYMGLVIPPPRPPNPPPPPPLPPVVVYKPPPPSMFPT